MYSLSDALASDSDSPPGNGLFASCCSRPSTVKQVQRPHPIVCSNPCCSKMPMTKRHCDIAVQEVKKKSNVKNAKISRAACALISHGVRCSKIGVKMMESQEEERSENVNKNTKCAQSENDR